MVLRLDDTDVERNTDASVQSIFEGLRWLGLDWDEEYKQSERLALHRAAGRSHLRQGPCLSRLHPGAHGAEDEQSSAQGAWLFNPGMRELSREESDRRAAAGEPFALRYRVPRGEDRILHFIDSVYGEQSKPADEVEDFALLRSDGMPTYHLASCVDDADLRISHIIRGQDHLTNTFKHLLIFEGARALEPRRSSRIFRCSSRPTAPSSPSASTARSSASPPIAMPAFCPRLSSTSSACSAGRPKTTASF